MIHKYFPHGQLDSDSCDKTPVPRLTTHGFPIHGVALELLMELLYRGCEGTRLYIGHCDVTDLCKGVSSTSIYSTPRKINSQRYCTNFANSQYNPCFVITAFAFAFISTCLSNMMVTRPSLGAVIPSFERALSAYVLFLLLPVYICFLCAN